VPDTRQQLVVDVRPRTVFKVAASLALLWCLWHLAGIILLLVVAVILAVALDGPVSWLERRHLSRSTASLVVSGALVITVVTFLWQTWSSLTNQWQYLTSQLATLAGDLGRRLPQWIFPSLQNKDWTAAVQPYALSLGQSIAAALTLVVLGFFVTVYLLIDGKRTLAWVVAFFPNDRRDKVAMTLEESRDVIVAYARGNLLTSIFAAAWVLVWMMVLHVPAALLLAVIAGIADFVPVLGFVASAIPAIALALTVSPRTALATLALWVIYHAIENYFVAPWAYGKQLKLSDLAVILAFVVGAELAGVIGALIALPIAALYPTIERIWLREQLPRETVREHRALSRVESSKLRS
jgi:predicted PurR-regulated permease PerM